MKSTETHKHSAFADVDELRIMVIWLGFDLKWHKAPEKMSKTNFLMLLHVYMLCFIYSINVNVATFKVLQQFWLHKRVHERILAACSSIVGQVIRPKHSTGGNKTQLEMNDKSIFWLSWLNMVAS